MSASFIRTFLDDADAGGDLVDNERALQMELATWLRYSGHRARFEKSVRVPAPAGQTKPQKRDIDILAEIGSHRLAIELKMPMSGRVPETIYDFYADISFMEAVVASGEADEGLCILLTSSSTFWSGRDNTRIYAPMRASYVLTGTIPKPTGAKDTSVVIAGSYQLQWRPLGNASLMPDARYVMVEVS